MIAQCSICGKSFEASGSAKYCSENCRTQGQRRIRSAWESRTGYKEKARAYASKRRESQREKQNHARSEEQNKLRKEFERENEKRQKESIANLTIEAENGDLWAKQRLALLKGDMLEYWRLRKETILEEDYRCGRSSYFRVGEIEVHSACFENQFVDMAKGERGWENA